MYLAFSHPAIPTFGSKKNEATIWDEIQKIMPSSEKVKIQFLIYFLRDELNAEFNEPMSIFQT